MVPQPGNEPVEGDVNVSPEPGETKRAFEARERLLCTHGCGFT